MNIIEQQKEVLQFTACIDTDNLVTVYLQDVKVRSRECYTR